MRLLLTILIFIVLVCSSVAETLPLYSSGYIQSDTWLRAYTKQFTLAGHNGSYEFTYERNGLVVGLKDEWMRELHSAVGWDALGSIVIPSTAKDDWGGILYVYSLEAQAFAGCKYLTSIIIPDKVITIGDECFSGCSSLKSMTIPNSVTSAGYGLFKNCSSLQSVIFPRDLNLIGDKTFFGCVNLQSVRLPSDLNMGACMFEGCHSLKNVELPGGITEIGPSSFYECSSLTNAPIPAKVKLISNSAFLRCTSLVDLVIPNSVTDIGECAFLGCTNLVNVVIPNSVTNIGQFAFRGCRGLAKNGFVVVKGTLYDYFGDDEDVTTPKGARKISCMFSYVTNLTSIIMRSDVDEIVQNIGAFASCASLTNALMSNSMGSIPAYTFSGCTNLESVSIGIGTTNIDFSAFERCTKLKKVYVPMDSDLPYVASLPPSATIYRYVPEQIATLDIAGGAVSQNYVSVTHGESYGDLPVPEREGYTFAGWTHEGKIVTCDTVVTALKDHVLTAQWKPIRYRIAFNSNGGLVWSGYLDCGSEVVAPIVTRTGYVFVGWSPAFSSTVPAHDVTYTAQWEEHPFTIDDNNCLTKIELATNTAVFVPEGVESVGENVVQQTWKLTGLVLPSTLRSINDKAFRFCRALQSVIMGANVTNIGVEAFRGCDNLKSIVLSAGLKEIKSCAFEDCTRLESIDILDGIESIGGGAFMGCTNLSYITIPGSIKNIGSSVFSDCNLTNVTIPGNVTNIGNSAFVRCRNLSSVEIEDGVVSIGDSAFWGCTNLMKLTLPRSIKRIGGSAFGYCSLTEVEIPETCSIDPYSTFDSDVVIRRYALNMTVALDAAGGSVSPITVNVMYKFPYGTLPVPIRQGYDFMGWMYAGGFVDKDSVVTALHNHTLTAQWGKHGECVCYLITFDANGGDGGWSRKMEYGAAIEPPTVTREGYTFVGWSPSVAATVPAEDVTFVAVWESDTGPRFNIDSEKRLLDVEFNGATDIVIPDGVKILEYGVFKGCSNLLSVVIPDSVTRIWSVSFENCSGLTSITIPNGVSIIEYSTFSGCSGLQSVVIGEGVTNIGQSAFYNCSSLTNLVIPSGVTGIGDYAFENCSGLKNVSIPDGVDKIARRAFYGCSGLQSVVIGEGVTNIEALAFSGCSSLTNLVIPSGMVGIGAYAFAACRGLNSVNIPDSVTSIGDWAFSGCSLTSVTIPDRVMSIGDGAFEYCSSLTSVTIPDSVTSIGGDAFDSCTGLVSVTIGSGVTNIGARAFSWCNSLRSITFNGDAPDVGSYCFMCVNDLCEVHVNRNSSGWEVDEAGKWNGLLLRYIDEYEEPTIPYQVTFDANGGDGGWSRTMEYGAAIEPPTVTREGYTFAGWSPSVAATVPAEDITYIARWTANRYTVKFDANGGNGVMDDVTCIYDGEALSLTNCFTRLGYSVVGWSSVDGDMVFLVGQEAVNLVSQNDGEITLYAIWTPNQYSVSFDTNGGDGGWSRTMRYGAAIEPPTVTREGYTFAGWSPSVAATVPAGDVTYTAQWTPKGYMVRFDANGGVGGWSQTMECGAAIVPPTVTRVGYTFAGWSPSVAATVPAEDITYIARWTANRYTVKFDANGGEGVMDNVSGVYDGEALSLTNCFTRLGYSVVGWATSADGDVVYPVGQSVENFVSQNDGEITLYAIWTPNQYSVSFDANGGVGGWARMMEYGAAIEPPTVSRTGYTFVGWFPSVAETVPAEDVIYTAQWAVNSYIVTFDANGGEGGWSRNMEYGALIEPPTVTRDGYEFLGWSPSPSLIVPWVNVTYTAQWKDLDEGKDLDTEPHFSIAPFETIISTDDGWYYTNLNMLVAVDLNGNTEISLPETIAKINDRAFSGCTSLKCLTIPSSVTEIGWRAFTGCRDLKIIFNGDAPYVDGDGIGASDCTAYVKQSASGWDCIDDFKRLVRMGESIRELSIYDDEEWRITQKIVYTGFVDEDAIISVINGNADEYRRFKAWAQSTDDGEAAVIMSTRAAKSYLLGAKALLDKELTSDDVKIESFSPTSTDGKFDFTVSVKDVNIGGGSVETETLKENLKKVLGVEGATTLTPGAFSSDNIDITFGSPVNGKAKISVSPPADAGNSFFMRVKVK